MIFHCELFATAAAADTASTAIASATASTASTAATASTASIVSTATTATATTAAEFFFVLSTCCGSRLACIRSSSGTRNITVFFFMMGFFKRVRNQAPYVSTPDPYYRSLRSDPYPIFDLHAHTHIIHIYIIYIYIYDYIIYIFDYIIYIFDYIISICLYIY